MNTEVLQNMSSIQIIIYTVAVIVLGQVPLLSKVINEKFSKKKIHSNCPNYAPMQLQIAKYVDFHDEIKDLEKGIVDTQMSVVSKTVVRIKSLVINEYKKYNSPERDFSHYCKIIFYVLHQNQNLLRDYVEANHIAEKSDKDYLDYIKEIKSIIYCDWDTILDEEYLDSYFVVSRKKLFDDNMANCMIHVDKMLDEMLFKIRFIAIEMRTKISALEEEKINLFKE